MTIEGGHNLAIVNIDAKVHALHEEIGKGTCSDYAEYLSFVGEIRGLLTAKRELLDALAKIEVS